MKVACIAIGLLCAQAAGAEALYRLPWADGMSFAFAQPVTYFTKATLHAIDIAMPEGTAVVAARAGIVEAIAAYHRPSAEAEPLTYEGNFVRVLHGDGTAATYAHLQHGGVAVAVGDSVRAGQIIGYSGSSGEVEEPHLHFAVTRVEVNSAGWREEVSLPVRFYVGTPPAAFAPRAGVRVRSDYSGPVEAPRAPTETRLVPWTLPTLEAGEEATAWGMLATWIACGLAALAWFWRFAKSG